MHKGLPVDAGKSAVYRPGVEPDGRKLSQCIDHVSLRPVVFATRMFRDIKWIALLRMDPTDIPKAPELVRVYVRGDEVNVLYGIAVHVKHTLNRTA